MPHAYERLGVFAISAVLPHVPKKQGKKVVRMYAGKHISIGKKKLRIFANKGTKCPSCGLEGTLIALERQPNATTYHFNIYGVGEDGVEIQFTLDHIIPRARGGSNDESNLQPMCEPCNVRKADRVNSQCSNMRLSS